MYLAGIRKASPGLFFIFPTQGTVTTAKTSGAVLQYPNPVL